MANGTAIGRLRVVIGADTSGLDRGLKKASGGLSNLRASIRPAVAKMAALTAASAAAATAVSAFAKSEMNLIDSQAKLARAIGGTVNGLRAFKLAAEDMGIDGVEASLNRMNRRLGAAEFGAGAAAVSVKMLGLDLKALASMDVQERMASIADTIQASGISSEQAARHLQNLGFEQQGVAELFMQGGDAIRASTDALDKYGLAVSELDVAKIEEANAAFDRLRLVTEGLKTQLATSLAPVFLESAQRLGLVAENLIAVRREAKSAREELGDMVPGGFVDNVLYPTARVVATLADGLGVLVRMGKAVGGSLQVVAADIQMLGHQADVLRASMNPANLLNKELKEELKARGEALSGMREAIISDANAAWKNVIYDDARKYRDAVERAWAEPLKPPPLEIDIPTGAVGSAKKLRLEVSWLGDLLTLTGNDYAPSAAKSIDGLGSSFDEAASEAKRFAAEFERTARQLDTHRAAADDLFDALETLERGYRDGLIPSLEEFEALQHLAIGTMGAAETATQEFGGTTERVATVMKSSAEASEEAWVGALRRIDDAFADVWRGAFDSFKDFANSLKNAFKNLLAELAHSAITRPIMLSLGASMGIVPGQAAAAGGGASGVSGALGGIGSALGGTGASDLLNKTIPGAGGGWFGGSVMGMGLAGLGGGLVGSQFGGQGGIGGGLGGALGYSLGTGGSAIGSALGGLGAFAGPVGALGGALLGGALGGLFGGKKSGREQYAEPNFATGYTHLSGGTGAKFSQENRDAVDAIAEVLRGVASSVTSTYGGAVNRHLSISASDKHGLRLGDVSSGPGWKHESYSSAEALVADGIRMIFEGATADIPSYVRALVGDLSGDVDQILAATGGLLGISKMLGVDAVAGARGDYGATNTALDEYQRQSEHVRRLAADFDGSAAAIADLSGALEANQAVAYNVATAYLQASDAVRASLEGLGERIRMDLMGEEELYNYRRAQAESLAASLEGMIDPAQIASTVDEIERITGAAWGSLAREQQAEMGDEFLSFLEGANALAQQQLDAGLEQIEREQGKINNVVNQSLEAAAASIERAAAQQLAAAQTMVRATQTLARLGSGPASPSGGEVYYA